MKRIPGIAVWPDDEMLLLELMVVDKESRGSWTNVSELEVRQACSHFGLPFHKVMEIIENKDKDVHTLMINVPDFMAYLEEQEEKE